MDFQTGMNERLWQEVDDLRRKAAELEAENARLTAVNRYQDRETLALPLERLARHANEGDDLLERAVAVLQAVDHFALEQHSQLQQLVLDIEHHLEVEGE